MQDYLLKKGDLVDCYDKNVKIAKSLNIADVKASCQYIKNFFAWNNLPVRQKTSISQWHPDTYEEKRQEFHKYIINCWKENKYLYSQTWNAD